MVFLLDSQIIVTCGCIIFNVFFWKGSDFCLAPSSQLSSYMLLTLPVNVGNDLRVAEWLMVEFHHGDEIEVTDSSDSRGKINSTDSSFFQSLQNLQKIGKELT